MNWKKTAWTNWVQMMIVYIFINTIILIIDVMLIISHCAIDKNNLWNYGWIILGFQIIYTVLSFKTVGPDEKAAVLFFGRPLHEVRSGLVFVPWLICSLRKESRLTIQIQIPGEPEEIDKSGDDEKGVSAGKVLPIRATTGSYETVKKNSLFTNDPSLVEGDPLNQRMTLEPSAQIRFKIKNIVKFIGHIGSITEAKKQLRDTAEGVIKSEFAKRTPALIIAHWSEISNILKLEIGKMVKDDTGTIDEDEGWGVVIETAQLLDVDITKKVNEALSAVSAAKITANRTVTEARAARTKSEEEGAGIAKARELLLIAESVGMTKLAKLAKTPEGQITLIVQQAKEMYEKAQYSILPGNGEGLYGAVAGIQEVLKRIQGEDNKVEQAPKERGGK